MCSKITVNKWQLKCSAKSKLIKGLRRDIRRLKKNRDKWKSKYRVLNSSVKLANLTHHQYPLELIWLGIYMRICLNISLRGVSQSLAGFGLVMGLNLPKLHSTTIRNWSLKYGHYCLNKSPQKGEYALICDESIVIGQEQVLLVLAVPIGYKSYIKPLEMCAVQVLEIEVKSSWKSADIALCLRRQLDKAGLEISYVISDNGAALNGAYKLCKLKKIDDCMHRMANVLKKLYGKDAAFLDLIKQMNLTRARWVKSQYSLYLPPALRSKSRFHQLFTISEWGKEMLKKWAKMPEIVQNELIYLQEHALFIDEMYLINELIKALSRILKSKGITPRTYQECETILKVAATQKDSRSIQEFVHQMQIYLRQQQQILPDKGQILCSSDIIESMFGKFKNQKNTREMLTENVLTIAAFGGNLPQKNLEEVQMACLETKIKDIQKWKKEKTIPSIITRKKQFKAA